MSLEQVKRDGYASYTSYAFIGSEDDIGAVHVQPDIKVNTIIIGESEDKRSLDTIGVNTFTSTKTKDMVLDSSHTTYANIEADINLVRRENHMMCVTQNEILRRMIDMKNVQNEILRDTKLKNTTMACLTVFVVLSGLTILGLVVANYIYKSSYN